MANHKRRYVDWDSVKLAYLSGELTNRAVCERYGVSRSALKNRINRGQWRAERIADPPKRTLQIGYDASIREIETANAVLDLVASTARLMADPSVSAEAKKEAALTTRYISGAAKESVTLSRIVRGLTGTPSAPDAEVATVIGLSVTAIPVPELTPFTESEPNDGHDNKGDIDR